MGINLDFCCRDPQNEFIRTRWPAQGYFKQAILINMKGQGGPVTKINFPMGSYMMYNLRNDPDGGRRMEYELFTRLSGHREAATSLLF